MLQPESALQEKCLRRIEHEMKSIRKFRSSGGKTMGYLCKGFPPSIAAGLGFRPVRVLQEASVEMEDLGGKLARQDICPLIKVFLGGIDSGRGLFGLIDVWMGLATCDQTRRCFYALADMEDVTVHHVQLPATRSQSAAKYFSDQLQQFCLDCRDLYGFEYSAERALNYSKNLCKAGEILSEATLSRQVSPLDLHWLFHLFLIADPDGLADILLALVTMAEPYSPDYMIALAGGPLALEDTWVLQAVQNKNAGVIPLHCAGLQLVPFGGINEFPVSGAVEELADRAFKNIRCARSRPNTEMFQYISDSISETSSDGLILKTLKFCDLWFTERERFRSSMNVPVLVLDTSYGEGEAERQRNRVDAFLETIAL